MTKNEVAVQEDKVELPAELLDEIAGEEGLGYSDRPEDSMVPILGILQDNSGEVKKRHSRSIEGAEAGDLIIRSLGRVLKMGETDPPLIVQPCGFDHMWVEWEGEPGEGNPVGQFHFESKPDDAEEVTNRDGNKEWRRGNGNRLVDTRYHYCNLIEEDGTVLPVVIPFGGTNHTVSRQWTALMRQFTVPGRPGVKAKSFMRTYSLRTQFKQRGEQSWYIYAITDLGWVKGSGAAAGGAEPLPRSAGAGAHRRSELRW
jgi:hypothetical protein